MDTIKVIVLGSSAVGKTSIIQQFIWNDFCEEYSKTKNRRTYYPSVIINDHLYQVMISDLPVVNNFPLNPYSEWSNFRFYGLRSASAYILVYDVSNIESFHYIRIMREQIFDSRDMRNVPILVVGNKLDLVVCHADGHHCGCVITRCHLVARRHIVNLIKKQWKCCYVECSAKYNWRVVSIFKELMKIIDNMEICQGYKEVCSPMIDNFHEALDRNKCIIL